MVYSTCSMSPYEDEAVIAELLRQYKGQLELVDARQFIPVFRARPGMSDWHVMDDHFAMKRENNDKKNMNKKIKIEKKAQDAAAAAASNQSTAAAEGSTGGEMDDAKVEVEVSLLPNVYPKNRVFAFTIFVDFLVGCLP